MRVRSLGAVVVLAGSLVAVAPSAQAAAAPAVQITRVWYDSPGVDRRGNASLNAEYVRIKNTTRKAINLEEWVLHDKTGYKYLFGVLAIKPGKTITVRTGQGDSGTSTLFWGRRAYVWNNDADTAYLRRADGRPVDSCAYRATRSGYVDC
ncbi:lamin tail domain-containing protein [Sphaerisporangium aureirubrum]|uniref:Lamin tail domain-containing protein n=1 Tax=Sphaerisporangium aureirubrum TaxID=1544736 RepID=A0ABW1N9D9_9ACTN